MLPLDSDEAPGEPGPARVLVLAPHHDDEAIGCGGLLLRAAERGASLSCAFVFDALEGAGTPAAERRLREAEEAARVLGISSTRSLGVPCRETGDAAALAWRLVEAIRAVRPTLVLIPHELERDPEHQLVHRAAVEALWLSETGFHPELGPPAPPVRTVLGYEVWTPIPRPQLVMDITAQLPRKLEAIARYGSQMEGRDYAAAAAGLARYRGVMMGGCAHAEAYTVVRADPRLPDL